MSKNKSNPFNDKAISDKDKENQKEEAKKQEEHVHAEKQSDETSTLQKKYDELNQQYIRLAADFDNYRKRQAQERESLISYGTENALSKMIEILDNFERADKSLENIDDPEKFKESFALIQKQVYETLSKLGLEEIKAIGEKFDPNFHEAVMQTPTDEHPEHTVIAELRKGYKLGDKVLRPTMVNVAVAK